MDDLQKAKWLEEHLKRCYDEAKETREQLEKGQDSVPAPEVLEPYDWKGENCYYIDSACRISSSPSSYGATGSSLFYGTTKENLKPLVRQLTYNSIIHNLKHAAGCGDYEFVYNGDNCYIHFDHSEANWDYGLCLYSQDVAVIYFPKEHADAILEGFKAAIATDERLKNE